MPSIRKLPAYIVSKIAAGEVAERPATIIKELIENSLDAEATFVEIIIKAGGTKLIQVRDNGSGMNREDLLLCYQPHTTSKIVDEEDLYKIRSFGFRGEALSSIAAASDLVIKSRPKGTEAGFMIELEKGELIGQLPVGMPEGTEIRVENLFASMPARRKFLKDSKIELRAISDVISRFALAFPKVAFTFKDDKDVLFSVPSDQSYADRVHTILGMSTAEHIIPINHESRYGKIYGYIGKPQTSSRSQSHHYIFVNNRSVESQELAKLIIECYGPLIEPRTTAPHVLYLDVPFESVDVNIHPRKEEVAFEYASEIKNLIAESISVTFKAHDLTYRDTASESLKPGMDSGTAEILKNIVTAWNPKDLKSENIIQIDNVYLVAPTPHGIIIADQHAAHERILFEQFKNALAGASMASLKLSEPVLIELSLSQTLALEGSIDALNKLGYEIELFGARTFKISAIPELLKTRDIRKHLISILDDILEHGSPKNIDRETERTLAYLSCRSAIKAGDALTPDERKRLIEKLLESKSLYTCPHGRPTHIELSVKELDRLFKRS